MKKLNEELLSKTLNIDDIEHKELEVYDNNFNEVIEADHRVVENTTDVGEDTEYARGNIKDLITKGQTAIKDLIEVARISQSPRAYEVVANLLKNISDLNKDLLEVQKKKVEIESVSVKTSKGSINVDKAILFTGSTSEFIKMIKKTTDTISGE